MRNLRRKSATSSPAFSRKPPTKRRRTDPARLNLTRRLTCFLEAAARIRLSEARNAESAQEICDLFSGLLQKAADEAQTH